MMFNSEIWHNPWTLPHFGKKQIRFPLAPNPKNVQCVKHLKTNETRAPNGEYFVIEKFWHIVRAIWWKSALYCRSIDCRKRKAFFISGCVKMMLHMCSIFHPRFLFLYPFEGSEKIVAFYEFPIPFATTKNFNLKICLIS